ncbi:MAG TPA: hypothetical protein VGX45_01155 [Solirubrobacteraceae bacterium]|nr:hypothetical protein [Solirubrobacteraceae bacterium]
MERVIKWLRPHPSRGDVIAAGAVPLSVLAFVIPLRMTQWATGPKFVVVAVIAMLLFTMGWLAPLEDEAPRAYHTVLLVAGLLPMIVALVLFAELIGAAHPPGAGGFVWVFLIETALAWASARRANSGACTLIAAVAGAGFVFAFVAWAFKPHSLDTYRAMVVVLTLGYAAGSLRLRERRRRHAVQLINAGGLLTLLLAVTYLESTLLVVHGGGLLPTSFGFFGSLSAPFGWKLWILIVAFGLVAYAGVDRERGPAYIGVVMLLAFALLVGYSVSSRGSLVGWPLFLLIIGAGGVAIGLRPRAPLPPEPPTRPHVPPTVQPEPAPTERLWESPPPPPTIPFERSDDE